MERDSEAFVTLLTESQSAIYAYIMSVVHDHAKAKDILQETNLTLWRKAEQFEEGTAFKSWAFRSAYFHILNFRRKMKRDKLVFDDDVLDYLVERQEERFNDPEKKIEHLQTCMSELPENQKHLIEERYKPRASVQQIAKSLNKSEAAVSQSLFRIRAALQKCIEGKMQREGGAA